MAKAILRRMELEESTYLTSDYTTKLQSSKQYGNSIKADIQMKGIKQKAQREIHAPMDTLSLTKEEKIYNGGKTVSSTSGAGKTDQLHIKECNYNIF